jgi:hypothetical protein
VRRTKSRETQPLQPSRNLRLEIVLRHVEQRAKVSA